MHRQNIRFLTIEMFKIFKGVGPQIVKEIFQLRDAVPYQLRKQSDFQMSTVLFSDTESIIFLTSKTWEILPHQIQQL